MRIHRWEDLKRKAFTPKQLAEIERRAKEHLLEADLREMRKLLGVTQVQLAKRLRASQGHVSGNRAARRPPADQPARPASIAT